MINELANFNFYLFKSKKLNLFYKYGKNYSVEQLELFTKPYGEDVSNKMGRF